jgi:hypothetical protein
MRRRCSVALRPRPMRGVEQVFDPLEARGRVCRPLHCGAPDVLDGTAWRHRWQGGQDHSLRQGDAVPR